MTMRSKLFALAKVIALISIPLCAMYLCTPLALSSGSPHGNDANKAPFYIEVQDANGNRVAGPQLPTLALKPVAAELAFERDYQPGDRIIFGGPQRIAVRLDSSMQECLVYLAAAPPRNVFYEIPFGREEKQTGSAYAPESFSGKSHRVSLRTLNKNELTGYRNLALNPCDAQETEQAPAQIFPHASTNSVSRSLYDFAARNAIDGITQNGHHGVWPYQSWGPQLRLDLWWKLDFGRPVELDKIRLMVRADFPHDSYWKSADVEFSDGSRESIQITSSPEFQDFSFKKRRVSWFRLNNLVPVDPARWCSYIEVEAWGRDLR